MPQPNRKPKPKPNGELIRTRRKASGVKVGPFAAAVRCSTSHLMNVENGHKGASEELLHRIAAELRVPYEQVVAA